MIARRYIRIGALLLWLVAGVAASRSDVPPPEATLVVFRDGMARMPVFVAESASREEREAADELARVLGRMSGLAWPVRAEGRGTAAGFYVGRTAAAGRLAAPLQPATDLLAPKPGEIGPDGFRIWSRGERVFIEGATPPATFFAVTWLLQRQGGVRWFAPGDRGEVIPRRAEWSLPELRVVREPAYVSRGLTGLEGPEAITWARRNGLAEHLEYSHSLFRIIPPSLFDGHPAWFPQLGGQRERPTEPAVYRYQPNLALPEVAEFAGREAAEAFAREPGRASFSLGINDTVRFDQSEATRALVEPLRSFRGAPDYSPLVFTFMNRAAATLARTRTDRYLGCLAYFWCENVPAFPVHPQVVPYLTADRSQYYDDQFRAEDLLLQARWGTSGVRAFGLWEYAYGHSFLIPRVPHGALAESVHEAWLRGARGYLAEVGPQWGFDAFKIWMLTQLLWEPARPLGELAGDFFPGYYGGAAGPMQRFFAACERQWMAQPGPPYWIKFYQQEDQSLLFPPGVCRTLRGHLDEARRAAGNDPVLGERIGLTERAFAVTEAYVAFDEIRRRLAVLPAGEPESRLVAALGESLAAESRLRKACREAEAGTLPARSATELTYFVRNDPVPRLLAAAGDRDPAAPPRSLAALGPGVVPGPWSSVARAMADGRLSRSVNLARNSAFTSVARHRQEPGFLFPGSGELPADWVVHAMPTERQRTALCAAADGAATRALRIEGAWDTQIYQWLPAVPGQAYVARIRGRGRSSPGGDAGLFLSFLTAEGKPVGTHRMQTLPKGEHRVPLELVLADVAPAEAAWVGFGCGVSRQVAGDWFEAEGPELREVSTPAKP